MSASFSGDSGSFQGGGSNSNSNNPAPAVPQGFSSGSFSSFEVKTPSSVRSAVRTAGSRSPRTPNRGRPKHGKTRTKKKNRNPQPPRKIEPEDEIGAEMARLLNESTGFDYGRSRMQQQPQQQQQQQQQQHSHSRKRGRNDGGRLPPSKDSHEGSALRFDSNDRDDIEISPSFRPLFGPENRYRMRILATCCWILLRNFRPYRDVPNAVCLLRDYLFRKPPAFTTALGTSSTNATTESPLRQALRFCVAVAGLVILGCLPLASGVAYLAVSVWRFVRLVCFVISSFLVDWREVVDLFPRWCRSVFDGLFWILMQLDRVLLFGNRWRGREWNKNSFDCTDSVFFDARNPPKSSTNNQYLWTLPPPNALVRSSAMIPSVTVDSRASTPVAAAAASADATKASHPTKNAVPEKQCWGKATTEHIEAIDYCYIMLREEHIQRQYTRLRRRLKLAKTTGKEDAFQNEYSVSSLEDFRQKFVVDPSTDNDTNNFDPTEFDEETGISLRLLEILGTDDSFDDYDTQYDSGGDAAAEYKNSTASTKTLESVTPTKRPRLRTESRDNDGVGSVGSSSDGTTTDMNWMDVGTEIGMKLLGSSAVQKAMASHDTVNTINNLAGQVDSRFKKENNANDTGTGELGNIFAIGERTTSPFFLDDGRVVSTSFDSPGKQAQNARNAEHPDAYAEALPVHPMWTSAAAAAVSPSHSFATVETNGTKDDSLFGSPVKWGSSPLEQHTNGSLQSLSVSPSSSMPKVSFERHGSSNGALLPTNEELESNCEQKPSKSKFLPKLPKITKKLSRRVRKVKPINRSPSVDVGKHLLPSLSPSASKPKYPTLLPGVKIAVPLLPINPDTPEGRATSRKQRKERFQMATVVSSKRLCVFEKNNMPQSGDRGTNCLSITVALDKCFLRNGQFATMSIRIMDKWDPRYMPKHSKLPMGSCVATSFGLGVLVGWRVEDDCHIVRALWQHRGSGSAFAYLRRDSIHATMEAAVGFEANTSRGRGTVVGYVNGGPQFKTGRYLVSITDEGCYFQQVVELNRKDVLSCESAKFIPIVEHIRAAAQYQLQIDRYTELHKAKSNDEDSNNKMWGEFHYYSDILWKSFLRAIEKDDEFDDGMNEFIQNCVNFLNQLDASDNGATTLSPTSNNFDAGIIIHASESSKSLSASSHIVTEAEKSDSGFWLMNKMFNIFPNKENSNKDGRDVDEETPAVEAIEIECTPRHLRRSEKNYNRAFAVLQTLTRTVTIAKAASADEPNFKIALSVCHEFLLFVKTVIKVQQKNMNHESLEVWRSAWREIVSVFGPVQQRLKRIGEGIAERMEKHGRRAKARLLRFVDIIAQDDALFFALEQGHWTHCAQQLEIAIVQANIIDIHSREHYRKTVQFLYNHFSSATSPSNGAAARNNKKLSQLLTAVQLFAAPRKALLELFLQDWVLEMLERIFVRAFSKDEVASRMLNIHCSNFQELRRFRMLKDFTIAGKLWIPLLDAADEEFSWAVSKLPANAQEYLAPISSLFSLCVVQFHKIDEGDLTKDWLDFLMEEEAAKIIHDMDMKLILALESFSRDVRDTMVVLPYYPSIDDDILNLVDDIDVDAFVKEASVSLEDEKLLRKFIKEKATIMVERFLDYLPKIAIPVEKRDLSEGWTLTCRGAGGGDLTLTELNIKRENLTCQVMGGDSLLFPAGEESENVPNNGSNVINAITLSTPQTPITAVEETSILNVIRKIIENAQRDGCYRVGEGGISHPPTDKYAASVLGNIPVSSVLNCAIELWRGLEIDDDELLEVAIRDVSYQIQISEDRKNKPHERTNGFAAAVRAGTADAPAWPRLNELNDSWNASDASVSFDDAGGSQPHRFNPRVDPTVLFLEIKKLTFNLENFLFHIEKHESKKTIFDPAFEGTGSILVKNVLIKLRVECFKGYLPVPAGRHVVAVPVLQLTDLDVSLEQVRLEVQDTGADWILNKIVDGFGDRFADIISSNLCEQVRKQMEEALGNINGYFAENPDVLLGVLDICIDDLDEMTVFV